MPYRAATLLRTWAFSPGVPNCVTRPNATAARRLVSIGYARFPGIANFDAGNFRRRFADNRAIPYLLVLLPVCRTGRPLSSLVRQSGLAGLPLPLRVIRICPGCHPNLSLITRFTSDS